MTRARKETVSSSQADAPSRRINRRGRLPLLIVMLAGLAPALLLTLALPAPAAATDGEPVIVNVGRCQGVQEVPSGVPITITLGWEATQHGLVRAFLTAAELSVTVDGELIPNANQLWGPIFETDTGNSRTRWAFTLDALPVGESYNIQWDLALSHRITDGYPLPHPNLYGPGSVVSGSCTITAP